jgi:hypothetical protein
MRLDTIFLEDEETDKTDDQIELKEIMEKTRKSKNAIRRKSCPKFQSIRGFSNLKTSFIPGHPKFNKIFHVEKFKKIWKTLIVFIRSHVINKNKISKTNNGNYPIPY